jgi:membrane-bound metal-dependent hydrolase YbcI (DUF457 family)
MPLAFPSHQGLIAPLWRRWPRCFVVLPCCVGAATPDIVDALLGLGRGHLGQWYGHSILGLFFLSLPAGLLLTAATKGLGSRTRWAGRIDRWSTLPRGDAPGFALEAWSVWVGASSHLIFDFLSHGKFVLLYPWHRDLSLFPTWWSARWCELPLPFYSSPYPIGPHFVVWVALSVVGAVMLFRGARRPP